MLVTLASAEDLKSEKIVLDPNKLDPSGKTAIDWFVPSRDGKYVGDVDFARRERRWNAAHL